MFRRKAKATPEAITCRIERRIDPSCPSDGPQGWESLATVVCEFVSSQRREDLVITLPGVSITRWTLLCPAETDVRAGDRIEATNHSLLTHSLLFVTPVRVRENDQRREVLANAYGAHSVV